MAVYPARSLRFLIEEQARKLGEKPAAYIVEATRQRLEREGALDHADKGVPT